MTPRAAPMSADERRTTLIEATLPLLHAHGRAVTSRQIAEAAGVAEGTIFRVFDSKDDLIEAALEQAFDIEPFLADLRRLDPDQSLRLVLTDIVTLLQIRFRGVFELMTAVGMVGPPKGTPSARAHLHRNREESAAVMEILLAPHAGELACPVSEFIHIVRLLTFSGSHPHISHGRTLTADEIVTTVLDGLHARSHTPRES